MLTLELDLLTARTNAEVEVFEAHSRLELSAQTTIAMAHQAHVAVMSALEHWRRVREHLMAGAPARHAKTTVESFLKVLRTVDRVFTPLSASWLKAAASNSWGPAKDSIVSLQESLAELRRFAEEAEGIMELLSRPRKPMSAEALQQARESFAAGTYQRAEDVVRERGKP